MGGFKNKDLGMNMKAAADMCNPITTYSGGWKVKMQLACAQLINADILMIDDPTGHLDVKNVAWVKQWLGGFPGSIVSTSPNSSRVCMSSRVALLSSVTTKNS